VGDPNEKGGYPQGGARAGRKSQPGGGILSTGMTGPHLYPPSVVRDDYCLPVPAAIHEAGGGKHGGREAKRKPYPIYINDLH